MTQIDQLSKLAIGLNIEGGFPSIDLAKINGHKIWTNLILVLDRPLIDNIIFDDLVKNNPYPLLENAIDEINEYQLFAVYLMIIGYYLEMANQKSLNVTIHIHQNGNLKSCQIFTDIVKKQVVHLMENYKFKVQVNYLMDNEHYQNTIVNYNETDILISLSQCAGLDPNIAAGAFIISNTFIPYDIDMKKINSSYQVTNDLMENIESIIGSKYNQFGVNYVNKNYKSFNEIKNKHHFATVSKYDDFYQGKILQVNKLWNPTDKSELITVEI